MYGQIQFIWPVIPGDPKDTEKATPLSPGAVTRKPDLGVIPQPARNELHSASQFVWLTREGMARMDTGLGYRVEHRGQRVNHSTDLPAMPLHPVAQVGAPPICVTGPALRS